MKRIMTLGLSGAATIGLLLAGGSAFAASTSSAFNPTIEYVGPINTTTGQASVLVSGLSSTQTVFITFEDEVGGQWKYIQEFQMTQSPPNPWYKGQVGTILFNKANAGQGIPIASGATALRVLEGTQESPISSQTIGNTVSLSPLPYGQLPEVPFAVGIPVVGIGAALLLKRKLVH